MVCWGGFGEVVFGFYNFLVLSLGNEVVGVGELFSLTFVIELARYMFTVVFLLLCVNNRTWRLFWTSG